MFHMTNDSNLFSTKAELEKNGAYPVGGNRWKKGGEEFVPLYEGKMVKIYDHRHSSVEVDETSLAARSDNYAYSCTTCGCELSANAHYWVPQTNVTDQ